jgi:hypothetical protein
MDYEEGRVLVIYYDFMVDPSKYIEKFILK